MNYYSLLRLGLFTSDRVLLVSVELLHGVKWGLDSEAKRQEESVWLDLQNGEKQQIYPKHQALNLCVSTNASFRTASRLVGFIDSVVLPNRAC